MDPLFLLARILHIVLGVFWAGTMIFNAAFLLPAIRDTGPDGGKVAAALMRRGFLNILPAAAALNLLAGLWLLWKVSAGFDSAYMRSPMGITYSGGAAVAFVAFGIGVGVMRRSVIKAAELTQSAVGATETEGAAQLARAQALRLRAFRAAQWVAVLLSLTAIAMAVGRYV